MPPGSGKILHSGRRRVLATGLVTLVAVFLFPHGRADGYRFSQANWRDGFPAARTAQLWSSEHWGFGDTLSWVVNDDPGWTAGWEDPRGNEVEAPFTRAREALPHVATALATWSELESADILWAVAGMEEGLDVGADGLLTVTVDPGTSAGAYAVTWQRRGFSTARWYTTECDVALNPWAAAGLGEDRLSSLIHEFGHCIGLDHAAVAPHSYHAVRANTHPGAWGPSPNMSYGPGRNNELHLDDIIGASLLRPAPGWLPTRGTISGQVTVAGAPAPFVSVWASRLSGSSPEVGVGGFADYEGHFVIEGLASGDYLIRAGPMLRTLAHFGLSRDATFDVNDGFALDLATVFPGIVTEGIVLNLLPSRGDLTPEPGARGRGVVLRDSGEAPCPGMRIRAAPPVFAANGQLATTVTIERSQDASGTSLHLLGPYVTRYEGSPDPPISATRIGAWRAENVGDMVRHEFDVEWPDEGAVQDRDLRIGFHGGSCSGTPVVVCSVAGCELAR